MGSALRLAGDQAAADQLQPISGHEHPRVDQALVLDTTQALGAEGPHATDPTRAPLRRSMSVPRYGARSLPRPRLSSRVIGTVACTGRGIAWTPSNETYVRGRQASTGSTPPAWPPGTRRRCGRGRERRRRPSASRARTSRRRARRMTRPLDSTSSEASCLARTARAEQDARGVRSEEREGDDGIEQREVGRHRPLRQRRIRQHHVVGDPHVRGARSGAYSTRAFGPPGRLTPGGRGRAVRGRGRGQRRAGRIPDSRRSVGGPQAGRSDRRVRPHAGRRGVGAPSRPFRRERHSRLTGDPSLRTKIP
jgi:hypothetical protein